MGEGPDITQRIDDGSQVFNRMYGAFLNLVTTRPSFLQRLITGKPDNIDEECGYPAELGPEEYRRMYDRFGIATRVVNIWPKECWQVDPIIFDDEDPKETEFEKRWKNIAKTIAGQSFWKQEEDEGHPVFRYLSRIDEVSGIGRFGVLLMGFDDGGELDQPVPGINERGEIVEGDRAERNLVYLRALDESMVEILESEDDESNPRYGYPTMYEITFLPTKEAGGGESGVQVITPSKNGKTNTTTKKVHWSRVIHVADNCVTSEIFGTPRQQNVYNHLWDLRKLFGGSAEMFWQGALMGLSIEMPEKLVEADIKVDYDKIKEQLRDYRRRLQRHLTLEGPTAKPLTPQVADPSAHIDSELVGICISIEVPKRKFEGSERGELASSQDDETWNRRLGKRQRGHINPVIIAPFVTRLICVGVLPMPKDGEFRISWPDLNTISDEEKATVLEKLTRAFATYHSTGLREFIPPMEYWTVFVGMTVDQAQTLVEASEELIAEEGTMEEREAERAEQAADSQAERDAAARQEEERQRTQ